MENEIFCNEKLRNMENSKSVKSMQVLFCSRWDEKLLHAWFYILYQSQNKPHNSFSGTHSLSEISAFFSVLRNDTHLETLLTFSSMLILKGAQMKWKSERKKFYDPLSVEIRAKLPLITMCFKSLAYIYKLIKWVHM